VSAPTFEKPTTTERLFNRVFGFLVGIGIGLSHNYLLQVRGRKSGRLYSMPVDVLAYRDSLYLVAPRGMTQWVRNAQAAGRIALKKGRTREDFAVHGVADLDKPEILKAYLDRFTLTVQRYFPVKAGAPVQSFEPLADRYPVFELVPLE